MNLLILKGFNNYFNRKLKKYSTLADYMNQSSAYYNFGDINFNPNDGVSTSQIVGSENQKEIGGSEPEPLKWEVEGSPDYIIAYEQETVDNNVITHIRSRWFVMESVRTRNGQYKLALKRDVLADYLQTILRSECFVEKGWVTADNPLIFNEESVSLNQIKKGETMLTDETGIPWIVLYLAKNAPQQSTSIKTSILSDIDQSAPEYDTLPWAGIENPAATYIDTSFTRRIAAEGFIDVSPIVAYEYHRAGVPALDLYPVRYHNFCYWDETDHFQVAIKSAEEIGTWKTWSALQDYDRVLTRKDIGLTPSSYNIHYTDDGKIVASFYARLENTTFGGKYGAPGILDSNQTKGSLSVIFRENIYNGGTGLKEDIWDAKEHLEADVSHSPVPGQEHMEAYVGGPQAFLKEKEILKYNGTLVKRGTNTYKIKVVKRNNYSRAIAKFKLDGNNDIYFEGYPYVNAANIAYRHFPRTLSEWSDGATLKIYENEDNQGIEMFFVHTWFDISYERVTTEKIRGGIPVASSRVQTNDAAYDMLCIPYGPINVRIPSTDEPGPGEEVVPLIKTIDQSASLAIARAIGAQLTQSVVYDIQILPYCPIREIANSYKDSDYEYIDIYGMARPYGLWNGVYKYENEADPDDRNELRSIILWCNYTHGTFDINKSIVIPEANSIEYKVYNNCKKFRLVAPNYTSIFEFEPIKNKGVNFFNVDYNYRPYNPYIHIAPFFESDGLYGVDTNDNRGLILQGDFSVGYYSDAWANYQIQNANYANIFNRQLQNIDFNQKQEREKWDVNRITGWVTEGLGLGGGMQGAKAFSGLGPWGMLGGGIGGTVGGLVGQGVGVEYYDRKWMNEAMAEERSYAIDNYNMALGNVKALPYGLAKSDALTENFKYFPFIEEYDCTDIEKTYFRNKLYYDGMTVGAIDIIENYIPTEDDFWVKICGRMIRLESLADDFQIANAIYTEVEKGFYYQSSYVNEGD